MKAPAMECETAVDSESATAAARAQWNRAAKGWHDSGTILRPWLHQATQAMLGMAAVTTGSHVLDVAAGAGDQTLDIAERVGPGGFVLATDLSPSILQFATERAAAAGHRNIETRVSDGQKLQIEDARFDVVVCRLGLMFFSDPLQGLREMVRVLRPGGTVCTMVFGTPQANPCVANLMSTARRHAGMPPLDPYQPGGLLSLGKPGLIDELFREAGFLEIATMKVAAPFKLPTVRDYMNFVRNSAGPVIHIMNNMDPATAEAAWADMENALGQYQRPDGWEGPNELLLTAARRP